ncbi:MAG: hypothetical protein ACK2T6_04415 [Anaerolineae bacterium]|jgi:cell division protein FtsB
MTATPPSDDRATKRVWMRIGVVVAVTLSVIYVVRLAGQVLDTRGAAQAEQTLATEVWDLEVEVEALETAAADAGSDQAVERWAREEKDWARAGDEVYEPVPASQLGAPTAEPTAEQPADDDLLSRVRRWLSGAE